LRIASAISTIILSLPTILLLATSQTAITSLETTTVTATVISILQSRKEPYSNPTITENTLLYNKLVPTIKSILPQFTTKAGSNLWKS
jgi:hypothetical protein